MLQVLGGVVQVAKIAVVVGLTALATDKLQKEYMTRQVQPPRLYVLTGLCSFHRTPHKYCHADHAGCASTVKGCSGASYVKINIHMISLVIPILCTQERHGQDHPVKPVSDRGLLGRKV